MAATALVALLWFLVAAGASHAAAGPANYAVVPGRYTPVAQFAVTYTGSGRWHTVYHSEPSNPGGAHDTNQAHDSSSQRWSLRFTRRLTIPRCGRGGVGCQELDSLTSAIGRTSATGRIDHRHIDGLYRADDAAERCAVRIGTAAGTPPPPALAVRYVAQTQSVSLTALIPVAGALSLLPSECPGQGDSLDGLLNSYFTPGFSFGTEFGPARWFTSRTVVIPVAVLDRAERITIPLSNTRQGTPPAHCVVPNPSYERCTTGGSWSGLLTLTAPVVPRAPAPADQ